MYKINTRVLAWDKDWIIPGTITAIEDGLYKIEYDCGGYDWLLCMVTISYRKHHKPVECEVQPVTKPSL